MRHDIPLREAAGRWRDRQPFDCNGTMRGFHGPPREYGWLTIEWVRYIQQFSSRIVYTVMSYQTPIAWVMRDGREIVPPAKHSVTTQRHVRALGVARSPAVVDTEEAA